MLMVEVMDYSLVVGVGADGGGDGLLTGCWCWCIW